MSELDKIYTFIDDTQSDIDEIIRHIDILIPERKELHDLIRKAWEEVNPRFNDMKKYLDEMDYKDRDKKLKESGLTGSLLEIELALHRSWSNEFKNALNDFKKDQTNIMKSFKWRILRKFLEKLLKSIQIILKSLSFIPGSEAVGQLKEVFEHFVSE